MTDRRKGPTKKQEALLGTARDTVLAKRWRVSPTTVGVWRRQRGIPRWGETCPPELRDRLGSEPDTVVAEAAGVSASTVAKWRAQLGIDAYNGGSAAKTSRELIDDLEVRHPGLFERLGKVADSALANEYGVSRQRIYQLRDRHGIDAPGRVDNFAAERAAAIPLLGTMPDIEIGKRVGMSSVWVGRLRKERCISAFEPETMTDRITKHPMLGKVADREIAADVGASGPSAVGMVRRRLGIPPYRVKSLGMTREQLQACVDRGMTDREIADTGAYSNASSVASCRLAFGIGRARKDRQSQ